MQVHGNADTLLVIDCLTLWLTNLLLADDPTLLARETTALLDTLPTLPGRIVLVTGDDVSYFPLTRRG